jgi:hypothetical protein
MRERDSGGNQIDLKTVIRAREVNEATIMPILLWIVFPFAIWSACMQGGAPATVASDRPKRPDSSGPIDDWPAGRP